MKQPAFFLPHGGGPCFFLNEQGPMPHEWRHMGEFLARVIADLSERPKAMLVISGHWEEKRFTVHRGERPSLLFDYAGFPAHTYQLEWNAPGAPELADRAAALLDAAGLPAGEETKRGWDHGVFIPLKVAVPEADIPVVQLSLRQDLDPAAHVAAGRALAPLRDEGVLIVGSGMSFHNMAARDGRVQRIADEFDNALTAAVEDPDPASREVRLIRWHDLPHARTAHPREEHLLPLMVVAGAGADGPGRNIFRDHVIGWTVSAFRFG
ncbi:MAG TPA: class III extradiol ring-cleavage dioxygenase [Allosphingosinicella sp.]|uniref:DODA-type extradiol aromatic ring-opening family dioxygenase n=1 Tax=Allosphingosinicella sp. TaxID=2823234 RepID=UPI002ED8A4B5